MFFVTGANGFLGSALIEELARRNYLVRASSRVGDIELHKNIDLVQSPDLHDNIMWSDLFKGSQYLIHTAARAHIMNDNSKDALDKFRQVNVEGTLNIARQAAQSGVRRFVYISSIKVNGEETQSGAPFTNGSPPNPQDPYGISKWEAEEGLRKISRETGLEIIIIRPPLIYGPGVKGNFHQLMKIIQRGLPLPLASIKNSRSMIGIRNCVDVIIKASTAPKISTNLFLVSDDHNISTPELIRRLANAMGTKASLFPLPVYMLTSGAQLLGKAHVIQRLTSSLEIDVNETKDCLDWVPPFDIDSELMRLTNNLAA